MWGQGIRVPLVEERPKDAWPCLYWTCIPHVHSSPHIPFLFPLIKSACACLLRQGATCTATTCYAVYFMGFMATDKMFFLRLTYLCYVPCMFCDSRDTFHDIHEFERVSRCMVSNVMKCCGSHGDLGAPHWHSPISIN